MSSPAGCLLRNPRGGSPSSGECGRAVLCPPEQGVRGGRSQLGTWGAILNLQQPPGRDVCCLLGPAREKRKAGSADKPGPREPLSLRQGWLQEGVAGGQGAGPPGNEILAPLCPRVLHFYPQFPMQRIQGAWSRRGTSDPCKMLPDQRSVHQRAQSVHQRARSTLEWHKALG